MKKKLFITAVIGATALAGCDTEANRVSYNLSQEADNFNDIRQITVVVRQIKRCLFRQIKTGFSEHLTRG